MRLRVIFPMISQLPMHESAETGQNSADYVHDPFLNYAEIP